MTMLETAQGLEQLHRCKMHRLVITILAATVVLVLLAGPALGFNVTSKIKASGFGHSAEMNVHNASSLDLGLVFGGGIEFSAGGTTKIGFEGRYTLGLSKDYEDVSNPGDNDLVIDDSGTAPDVKNSVIGFIVTAGF